MFLIGNKLTALIGEACNEDCEVEVSTYIADCSSSHGCSLYQQYCVYCFCCLHMLVLKFPHFNSLYFYNVNIVLPYTIHFFGVSYNWHSGEIFFRENNIGCMKNFSAHAYFCIP